MSNNSNTSNSNSSNESESEGPDMYEIFMQEFNCPLSQHVRMLLQQRLEEASTSNNRSRRPRRYIERNREIGEERIMRDNFCDHPYYTDFQFRTRFRMRKHLFLCIVRDLENRYTNFQRRVDATGRNSFSAIHKRTAAIRMLAYGYSADMLDETVRMAKCTILKCLQRFVKGIREVYGPTYLRKPNANDIAYLLQIGEARWFSWYVRQHRLHALGMENCPVAWHGAFTRADIGAPTIILEAVASQDLWIWHAFFGVAGSNNNLNVLDQSPLFTQHLQGQAPPINFQVNGKYYNLGYYLADGIYPEWTAFVKTISLPQTNKDKLFDAHQEGERKDVERAFGVLQSRFAIIRGPVHVWDTPTIKDIMYACIIMHNMLVEDERGQYEGNFEYEGLVGLEMPTMEDVNHGTPPALAANSYK